MSMVFSRVTFLAALLALFASFTAPAHANSKYAAFVIHADSGDILFDRYSTSKRYPASLTKMMTLYLLFEELEAGRLTMSSKLTVSKTATGQPPSKLGVKAGSTITVEKAIEALIVKSANDVAVVVAEKLGGSEWRFARKMTEKARAIGMSRTTFRNASGLPNSRQVTTARDMATLGQRLMQDFPQYFHYFSAKSFTWNGKTYRTHNSLVKTFTGADGIKTGYTRRSGFNLVTSAERGGQRLIGVVLGGRSSRTRDRHMRDILSKTFSSIKSKPTLIAALHRKKPSPRLKPTLVASLAANNNFSVTSSPVISLNAGSTKASTDNLGALIAAADTEEFNEYERSKLAALKVDDGFIGEGDRQPVEEIYWGVQIGAYSTKSLAQKELEAAAFNGGLMSRQRSIAPTQRDDGSVLYRARITQLSEIEAAAACSGLQDKGIQCFVVSGETGSKN